MSNPKNPQSTPSSKYEKPRPQKRASPRQSNVKPYKPYIPPPTNSQTSHPVSPRSPSRAIPLSSTIPTSTSTPRKFPIPFLIVGTVFVFTFSYYTTSAYKQITTPPPSDLPAVNLTSVYNDTAKDFDYEVDSTEYWYGIMKLRRKMVKQARGYVLESAAGTGRNMEFYDENRVKGLWLVDKSEGMLEVCRRKWLKAKKSASSSSKPTDDKKQVKQDKDVAKPDPWENKVTFCVTDLEDASSSKSLLPPNSQGFDTIIQTMALCSTDDPVLLLRSLGTLLQPKGRIFLLEHGQSYVEWLNKLLDNTAPQHAARHGCWWNRDIGKICEESGLQVVEIRRPGWLSFGTTWWVELKRRDGQRDGKVVDSNRGVVSQETKASS